TTTYSLLNEQIHFGCWKGRSLPGWFAQLRIVGGTFGLALLSSTWAGSAQAASTSEGIGSTTSTLVASTGIVSIATSTEETWVKRASNEFRWPPTFL
ncbi:hypothetical protein, partial [Mesorhizobium sp. M2A.F.Ca.ET.039.01.1.1]|uniref:hypothetical protein n=1 Tax=Mesorhizobium sp. M2A.F.Ca.ET.039.01.1.1 TaxID=2496746 RepID=UPI001AECE925